MAGAFVQQWTTSGNATAVSVTISPNPTVNNLLVLGVATEGGSNQIETPTGWTLIDRTIVPIVNGAMFYRVSDGAESSVSISDAGTAARDWEVVVGEYSGLDPSAPFETFKSNLTSVVATSLALATTTPSAANGMGISFFAGDDRRKWQPLSIDDSYTINYTSEDSEATREPHISLASKNYSAGALQHPTWSTTDTGDECYGVIAVFKEAAAESDSTPVAGRLLFKGGVSFSGAVKDKEAIKGLLQLNGGVPTSLNIRETLPEAGILLFKGSAPTAGAGVGASSPLVGKLVFKGGSVDVTFTPISEPGKGLLQFKGNEPSISRQTNVFPVAGNLVFVGGEPTITSVRLVTWSAIATSTASWSVIAAGSGTWSDIATSTASWSTI